MLNIRFPYSRNGEIRFSKNGSGPDERERTRGEEKRKIFLKELEGYFKEAEEQILKRLNEDKNLIEAIEELKKLTTEISKEIQNSVFLNRDKINSLIGSLHLFFLEHFGIDLLTFKTISDLLHINNFEINLKEGTLTPQVEENLNNIRKLISKLINKEPNSPQEENLLTKIFAEFTRILTTYSAYLISNIIRDITNIIKQETEDEKTQRLYLRLYTMFYNLVLIDVVLDTTSPPKPTLIFPQSYI